MIDFAHVEPIVRAVLYEGYVLYPYRASSAKNRYRWTFGGLYPRAWSDENAGDAWWMRTEVLVIGSEAAKVGVALRFLEVVAGGGGAAWQEAEERRVERAPRTLTELAREPEVDRFAFGHLRGELEIAAKRVHEIEARDVTRVRVTVRNLTTLDAPARGMARAEVVRASLASAHVLLGVEGGAFVSLVDPPAHLRAQVDACANVGTWPVLAGRPGRTDTVLSSPIILGDHAQVAPESPGDLFDGTEIDEILILRILTLTDAEKAEVRATDPRARALLDRAESLGADALLGLHGALRTRSRDPAHGALRPGARVILRPQGRADVFDLALAGKAATIASFEEDFEGRAFVTVTVDEDPGRDLGLTGQPGHRFFFRAEEVELVP